MSERIFFLELAFKNGFIFSEVITTLLTRAWVLTATNSEGDSIGTVLAQSHSECSESEDAESEVCMSLENNYNCFLVFVV